MEQILAELLPELMLGLDLTADLDEETASGVDLAKVYFGSATRPVVRSLVSAPVSSAEVMTPFGSELVIKQEVTNPVELWASPSVEADFGAATQYFTPAEVPLVLAKPDCERIDPKAEPEIQPVAVFKLPVQDELRLTNRICDLVRRRLRAEIIGGSGHF